MADVSKLTGFAVLAPASTAVVVSKVTGFVVLAPATITTSRRPIVNCCS
jgi:hypothetical protein